MVDEAPKKPRKTRAKASKKPAKTAVSAKTKAVDASPVVPAETTADAPVATVTLRKTELLKRVTAISGAKKKDAKEIVDATLQVLGDALSRGEELVLAPLGKAKIQRRRALPKGEMIVVKLRRGGGADAAEGNSNEGLAEADE